MRETDNDLTFKDLLLPLTTYKVVVYITIIGFIVYSNSLFNNFIGDDAAQIVNNQAVHHISNIITFFTNSTFSNGGTLTGVYYKPLLTTSYSLIYTFFQDWVFPYHLFQLFLHITNSILIFLFLKKYFRKELAFVSSLLFLLHPLNNEAIVSIAALQEPLFLFFGLLALLLTAKKHQTILQQAFIVILLLFSLLSKETGILFLVLLPIHAKLSGNSWRKSLGISIVTLALYLLLRLGVAHIYLDRKHVFRYSMTTLPLSGRLINIPLLIAHYIKSFFYPEKLLVNQRWLVTTINIRTVYFPLIIDLFFGLLLLASGSWIYKKHYKQFGLFSFFLTWFIIGIGLHLQIIPLDYTVADRWFYFPMIGLLGIGTLIISQLKLSKKHITAFSIIVSIILCVYAVRDIVRNSNWVNAYMLYTHDIKNAPANYVLQSGLGIELYNLKKYNEAKKHLLYSIELFPTSQNLTALGFTYQKLGDIQAARKAFQRALTYKDDQVTYQAYAKLLLVSGTPKEGAAFLRAELKKHPEDALLWLYLAVEDYKMGNKEAALAEVEKSNSLNASQESWYVYQQIQNNQPINIINND